MGFGSKALLIFAIIFVGTTFLCLVPAKGEPHVRIYDCGVLLENLHQRLREFAQGFLVAFCHLNRKNSMINSIQNAYHCCGSGMFIPDPRSEFFPFRIRIFSIPIRIKEFKYFNPKKLFQSSRKYDLGCSSRIRILIFLPIPDPESRS
jgi:hypothetical protein